MNRSSFARRFSAILSKEFVQMRRDRLTFAMMVGVPIMQLVLFGYAINADPRKLPTAVVAAEPPFEVRVHRLYNPEGVTQYNIVPGLIGTILTMTMVIMTSLAVTRERERGTMENLLAMPVRPFEVMLGKIVPYIVVGYVQVA